MIADLFINTIIFLPLVAAGYITYLKLRMADLSLETTWAVSGIVTLQLFNGTEIFNSSISLIAISPMIGILISSVTCFIFWCTGKQKLLSGMIAYFLVMAIGYRLLDGSAMIYAEFGANSFGFSDTRIASALWISIVSCMCLILLAFWEKSKHGIILRIMGETNGGASSILKRKDRNYYFIGILISGAFLGLGGAVYSIFYGTAMNANGIGLLVKALFASLAGERVLYFLRLTSRPTFWCVPVGAGILSFVLVVSEELSLKLQEDFNQVLLDTDKSALIGLLLLVLLFFRKRANTRITGAQW
ncbi:ABC transporter permease [Planctobacterium marinum]|uniref:hypothetical protein n=1 Tax=Planctobacterium marinum TaxID=1631968 RepID=UPI001E429411|nr:hypothetical protein [Planctobacterium marinum]MCC2607140.1 hypothetical protein [Planctobacterium marinum]